MKSKIIVCANCYVKNSTKTFENLNKSYSSVSSVAGPIKLPHLFFKSSSHRGDSNRGQPTYAQYEKTEVK